MSKPAQSMQQPSAKSIESAKPSKPVGNTYSNNSSGYKADSKPSQTKNSYSSNRYNAANTAATGTASSRNYSNKNQSETNAKTPEPAKNDKQGDSTFDKDGKPVKNKDRPSIQIYNPSQRAALRQQKQDVKN